MREYHKTRNFVRFRCEDFLEYEDLFPLIYYTCYKSGKSKHVGFDNYVLKAFKNKVIDMKRNLKSKWYNHKTNRDGFVNAKCSHYWENFKVNEMLEAFTNVEKQYIFDRFLHKLSLKKMKKKYGITTSQIYTIDGKIRKELKLSV